MTDVETGLYFLVAGKSALLKLPRDVQRATVRTRGSFEAPPGWRETPGAMHVGHGVWLIPVKRAALGEEGAP